jgi:preprotein translocase subunit SecE
VQCTMDVSSTLDKPRQFFREVRMELKKVTWPPRKETVASTSVVLVVVIIIGLFLGLVDLGLSRIVKIILS